MTATFQEMLRLGRMREHIVLFEFQKRGFFTVETAAIAERAGGAPKAHGPFGLGLILPDAMVAISGKFFALEIKSKTAASYNPNLDEWNHGVGLSLYHQYLSYQTATGAPFVLAFYEITTGELLVRQLSSLPPPRIYEGNKMNPGGMAFWQRKHFLVFAQISPALDLPLFRGIPLPPTLPPATDLNEV